MARFGEGNTNGTGRPKGSRNRLNTDIKEAFDIAFQGIGGAEALTEWARSHKSSFFKIYATMQPKKLQASVEHPHEDFIRYLQEEETKKLAGTGKPVRMIECDSEEIKEEKGKGKNSTSQNPSRSK